MARRIRKIKPALRARRTRQTNKVKAEVAKLNIGTNDAQNLIDALAPQAYTKVEFERSKKKLDAFKQGEFKRLRRYKDFSNLKGIDTEDITFQNVVRLLRDDSDWYLKNQNLVAQYNVERETIKATGVSRNELYNKLKRTKAGKGISESYNNFRAAKDTFDFDDF